MSIVAKPDPITFWNNRWVLVLTGLIGLYLVLTSLAGLGLAPSHLISNPVAQTVVLVGAAGGFAGARRFGGTGNYVGRLMLYFTFSVIASEVTWLALYVVGGRAAPSGFALVSVAIGFFAGLGIAAFGLAKAARMIVDRLDRRDFLLLIVTLVVTVEVAVMNALFAQARSPLEVTMWLIVLPGMLSAILVPALTVLHRIGRWYLSEALRLIVAGYVIFGLLVPIVVVLGQMVILPPDTFFTSIGIANMAGLYPIALGLAVMRPARSVQRLYYA